MVVFNILAVYFLEYQGIMPILWNLHFFDYFIKNYLQYLFYSHASNFHYRHCNSVLQCTFIVSLLVGSSLFLVFNYVLGPGFWNSAAVKTTRSDNTRAETIRENFNKMGFQIVTYLMMHKTTYLHITRIVRPWSIIAGETHW